MHVEGFFEFLKPHQTRQCLCCYCSSASRCYSVSCLCCNCSFSCAVTWRSLLFLVCVGFEVALVLYREHRNIRIQRTMISGIRLFLALPTSRSHVVVDLPKRGPLPNLHTPSLKVENYPSLVLVLMQPLYRPPSP